MLRQFSYFPVVAYLTFKLRADVASSSRINDRQFSFLYTVGIKRGIFLSSYQEVAPYYFSSWWKADAPVILNPFPEMLWANSSYFKLVIFFPRIRIDFLHKEKNSPFKLHVFGLVG